MSFNKIPLQAKFFYNKKWTSEMDKSFLTALVVQKNEGNWCDVDKSFHALLSAQGVVNATYGKSLSWDDIYERLSFLETRYETFKQIIEDPDVFWNRGINCVIAEIDFWKKIFKKNIFSQAYFHQGEPEFESLTILFGKTPSMPLQLLNHEVINISASCPIRGLLDGPIVLSDDEEVMSPMPVYRPLICKKLFNEDHKVMDVESSNDKGPHYIIDGPNGLKKFPLRNAFPPRPKEIPGPSKDDGSSSCASSSPSKWWFNPFK